MVPIVVKKRTNPPAIPTTDIPQNLYDGFLLENTKINDKARKKILTNFLRSYAKFQAISRI